MLNDTPSRIVTPPPPSPASAQPLPNRVLSVQLAPDEDVEWLWTCSASGVSYVSGYRVVKVQPRSSIGKQI